MTLTSLLIFLVVFAVVAYLAYWIIGHFPEPMRTPVVVIVGVVLLLVLLAQFVPDLANYRIMR